MAGERRAEMAARLEAIRSAVDLAALVGRDVALKRHGREFVGLSPFQAERTPSFTVVPAKGFWHCFSSGEHGDAIDWMVKVRGLDFVAAVEALESLYGLGTAGGSARGSGAAGAAVLPPVAGRAEREAAELAERHKKRHDAHATWRARVAVDSVPAVVAYLAGKRCLPERLWSALPVLGASPSLDYWVEDGQGLRSLGRFPALLAAIQTPRGGFGGLHVTWLEPDGSDKLDVLGRGAPRGSKARKVRGDAQGGAIRLGPPAATLYCAEGIETALSVMACAGTTCWALYSFGNFHGRQLRPGPPHPEIPDRLLPGSEPDLASAAFVPPPMVRKVVWAADNDAKDPLAARAKVERGLARLRARGLSAAVAWPPAGCDFNDLLVRAEKASKPPAGGSSCAGARGATKPPRLLSSKVAA